MITAPFWNKLPVSVHGWPSSCVKLHQIAFYSRLVAERIILMIIVSVPQNSLLGVFLIIFIVLCCWIIMTPVTRYRLYCKAVGKVILSSPSLLLWIIIVIVFRCGCTSYLLARCDPILLIVSCCRMHLCSLYFIIACSMWSHSSHCILLQVVSLLSSREVATSSPRCELARPVFPLEMPTCVFLCIFPSFCGFPFFLAFLLLACCNVRLLSSFLPAGQINTNCNWVISGVLCPVHAPNRPIITLVQTSNISGAVSFSFVLLCLQY